MLNKKSSNRIPKEEKQRVTQPSEVLHMDLSGPIYPKLWRNSKLLAVHYYRDQVGSCPDSMLLQPRPGRQLRPENPAINPGNAELGFLSCFE